MPGNLSIFVEAFAHKGKDGLEVTVRLIQNSYKGKVWGKGLGKIYVKGRIAPEHWAGFATSTAGNWITDGDPMHRERNTDIAVIISKVERLYYELKEFHHAEPTTRQIMDAYRAGSMDAYKEKVENDRATIFTAIDDYVSIKMRGEDGEFVNKAASTTEQNYMDMGDALRRMLESKGKKTIYLEDLDDTLLYQFELFLTQSLSRRNKPYAHSTIVKYIEKLHSILLHIHKIGEVKVNTASNYKPNTILGKANQEQSPEMWKISPQDLARIESVVPPKKAYDESEREFHEKDQKQGDLNRVRLLFLFQSWTGLAYSDLVACGEIKQKIRVDLSGRRSIVYNRVKTGGLAIVPIFEQTNELLKALEFNVAPQTSYLTFKRKLMAMLSYYNVKTLADDEHSKTHLGRHLCGTRMLALGMSMESVSRILGHFSIRETEKVYARIDSVKLYADVDRIQLLANDQFGSKIAI